MGDGKTAVTLDIQNIYVRAAFWRLEAIQSHARHYNFSTDVSYCFERGVDYVIITEHIKCINTLILEICDGQAGPINDQITSLPKHGPAHMHVTCAAHVLGIPLSHGVMVDVFKCLGLTFSADGDMFMVESPSYRLDFEIEEDLIEEVARIYGFEWTPTKPPMVENAMRPTDETHHTMHDVHHAVAVRDYHEIVNFAFVEAEWKADFTGNTNLIPLPNPAANQHSAMCNMLVGGLLNEVHYGPNRKAS